MTTFEIWHGNLLSSGADCLVNATNVRGVMGAGIAAQFRRRWPEMFGQYRRRADERQLIMGQVHAWRNPDPGEKPDWICNLHTKVEPRDPSRYLWVVEGLIDLAEQLNDELEEVRTIAVPALGCGLGGLDWRVVEALARDILGDVGYPGRAELTVYLYPPHTPWSELKQKRREQG